MKKERFEEILFNLKIEREKWLTLTEIESIVLDNGRGIYPDWIHIRFLITKNNEIIIKYGNSEPYGCRLASRYSISYNNMSLSFPPENVIANSSYCKEFRLPKKGDIIRSTVGCFKILSESVISGVQAAGNTFYIDLLNPIKYNSESHLSFYDPKEYELENCIHGNEVEGIYTKFQENNGKNKKFGIQHEIIKIKNIKEINLKLLKHNKTYKLS